MKKIRGHWSIFWHLMWHLIKLDFSHRKITQGKSILFLGKEIWYNSDVIGCTCGKIYYCKKFPFLYKTIVEDFWIPTRNNKTSGRKEKIRELFND